MAELGDPFKLHGQDRAAELRLDKLRRENDAIKKGIDEARDKAIDLMEGATIQMVTGQIGGLEVPGAPRDSDEKAPPPDDDGEHQSRILDEIKKFQAGMDEMKIDPWD